MAFFYIFLKEKLKKSLLYSKIFIIGGKMKVAEFISAGTMEKMRLEISKSGGNEVFFRGIPDGEGIVADVEVIARGNSGSVAALLNMMRKNEVIIHNHPSGVLIPSDEDVNISSMYGEVGGASYIVNNAVDDIYVIVPLKEFIKIDIAKTHPRSSGR